MCAGWEGICGGKEPKCWVVAYVVGDGRGAEVVDGLRSRAGGMLIEEVVEVSEERLLEEGKAVELVDDEAAMLTAGAWMGE